MYKIKKYIVQKYCWYMVRLYKTNIKKYRRINNFMYKTKIIPKYIYVTIFGNKV